MLTVKQAAQRAGISPTTLRAWERRYDVLEPGRTPAGYRVYDERALDRLRTMAALVHAGWSPARAAEHVRAGVDDAGTQPHHRSDGEVSNPEFAELAEVAATLDSQRLASVLDRQFAREDLEAVVVDWLIPSMQEVGLAWADEQASVAGEHLVSSAVLGRISEKLQTTPSEPGAPVYMVGLPVDAHHEIGSACLALLLKRKGLEVQYVSTDLPAEEWVRGAMDGHAEGAVMTVPLPRDADNASQALHQLALHAPDVTLYVGGGGRESVTFEQATVLGDDLRAGADLIATQAWRRQGLVVGCAAAR